MNAPSTTDIANAVKRYLDAVADGTAEEIADCFAEDATQEDPVGSGARRGRAEIEKFYSAIESARRKTELVTLRIAGDGAAFHFVVTTEMDEHAVEIGVIDVMTFDEQARITSMRAYWNSDDVRMLR
ncbi:nuclear transport factor 2 family protein [Cryptosporangium minutisporangium]|uniref:Nuclear transport factor 2 family protein n=1 Tax=Cryptosporangium minutisporangium TaxID=113569 RepID=A0ABP6SRV0_9ACTN